MSENKPASQRVFFKFIAYLQIIGIILVVLGHSFHQYPDNAGGYTLFISRSLHNFRMPLFIFVSGFLMMYTEYCSDKTPSVRRFCFGKIKRLLIPYLVLTVVTYVPRVVMSRYADDSMELSFSYLLQSLYTPRLHPIPFFWFIQASFILLLVTYIIISVGRHFKISDHWTILFLFTTSLLLGMIEWPGENIFSYQFAINYSIFFISGIAYCLYFTQINRFLPLDNILSFIISAGFWLGTFLAWEGTPYEKLSSFFGIAMCISLAKLMVKHHITLIDHLVGANYIIFLLSWYFNVAAQQILSHFITLPWWVYTIFSLICGIYIPWLGYIYLRKNQHRKAVRHISFLLGQSFRKPPREK